MLCVSISNEISISHPLRIWEGVYICLCEGIRVSVRRIADSAPPLSPFIHLYVGGVLCHPTYRSDVPCGDYSNVFYDRIKGVGYLFLLLTLGCAFGFDSIHEYFEC